MALGHSDGGPLGWKAQTASREWSLADALLRVSKDKQQKEVLWHSVGAHAISGEREVREKGNRHNLFSGGHTVRLEGRGSLPFLTALYRLLICKETDARVPADWSAAAQVREPGTERLRILTRMLKESAVQYRRSLYTFASIAEALFSNVL